MSYKETAGYVGTGSVDYRRTTPRALRAIDFNVQQFTATGMASLKARQVATPIDSELVFLVRRETLLDTINTKFRLLLVRPWWLLFGVWNLLALSLAVISYFRNAGYLGPWWTPAWEFTVLEAAEAWVNQEGFLRVYWHHLHGLGRFLGLGQYRFLPNDAPSRMRYMLFEAFVYGVCSWCATDLLIDQFKKPSIRPTFG